MIRKSPTVPAALIGPILAKYIEENQKPKGTSIMAAPDGGWDVVSVRQQLCEKVGVGKHYLAAIIAGRQKTMSFDIADRLLCAMHMPHLWLVEPLRDVYYGLKFPETSTEKERRPAAYTKTQFEVFVLQAMELGQKCGRGHEINFTNSSNRADQRGFHCRPCHRARRARRRAKAAA